MASAQSNPGTASLWRPLRSSTFRNLLVANVVSDIGAFMQSVGAAWLMVSLNAGPFYVALTQTAAALPFFLFAFLAGRFSPIGSEGRPPGGFGAERHRIQSGTCGRTSPRRIANRLNRSCDCV